MDTIYLDNAATTPLDPRVLEEMMPFLKEDYGNASSVHNKGLSAKVAVEEAREKVAFLINAEPSEIIFTSGGTESDNAAIFGVMDAAHSKNEFITSPVEHHAILHAAEATKRHGGIPLYTSPDSNGVTEISEIESLISDRTALVSLMHVNNETGGINPVHEFAEFCRNKGVPFHTDAVQSAGKLKIDVRETGFDLMSMSAHKIYGPKGTGVLYVRNGTPWLPWMQGGSQEWNRRGGTSNTAGIVGFAAALEIASERMQQDRDHFRMLRKELLAGLDHQFKGRYQINGPIETGVPYILNVAFIPPDGQALDGEMLLLNLDVEGICISSGSACTSGAVESSHVLTGIGVPERLTHSSIRISFGRMNTVEHVRYLLDKLTLVLNRMMSVD